MHDVVAHARVLGRAGGMADVCNYLS
jgi:hypothetical protein